MAISEEAETTTTDVDAGRPRAEAERSLVLVAGSGTERDEPFQRDLAAARLPRAQPEVPADATNPRGFAESQWVVDFHTRLLQRRRRPGLGRTTGRLVATPPRPLSTRARTTSSPAGSGSSSRSPTTLSSRTRACPGSCRSGGAAPRRRRLAALRRRSAPSGGGGRLEAALVRSAGRATSAGPPAGSTRRSSRSAPRGRARASSSATRIFSTTGRASLGHVGESSDLS